MTDGTVVLINRIKDLEQELSDTEKKLEMAVSLSENVVNEKAVHDSDIYELVDMVRYLYNHIDSPAIYPMAFKDPLKLVQKHTGIW